VSGNGGLHTQSILRLRRYTAKKGDIGVDLVKSKSLIGAKRSNEARLRLRDMLAKQGIAIPSKMSVTT
jgi:hypothetical protein